MFDVNGDGTICAKELQRLFQTLGQTTTASEIRKLLEQWGLDTDGKATTPVTHDVIITSLL